MKVTLLPRSIVYKQKKTKEEMVPTLGDPF